MTYHIVLFKNENSVETVPSNWLSKDGITCAWPNKHLNPSKQIEKKTYPNTQDFKWYEVRVLSKDIATLKEAKIKSSTATFTSDLSDYDDKKTRQSRCSKIIADDDNYYFHCKNKPKISSAHYNKNHSSVQQKISTPPKLIDTDISDNNDDSDSDKTYIPNVNNKRKFKSPFKYFEGKMKEKYQQNSLNQSPSQQLLLYKSSSASRSVVLNSPSSEKWKVVNDDSQSPTKCAKRKLHFDSIPDKIDDFKHVNSFIQSPNICEDESTDLLKSSEKWQITDSVTLDPSKTPIQYSQYNDIFVGLNKTLTNLTRSITNIKYYVQNNATKLDRLENMMSDFQKSQNKLTPTGNNYLVNESIFKFPITNLDDLKIFEEKLMNTDYRQKVIQFLVRLERETVSDMTRQIMAKIFSNNILSQFSYAGQKKKMVFSVLHSCAIIFETIRTVQKHRNCTDQEILKPMKFYMANAKFREEKKHIKIIPFV